MDKIDITLVPAKPGCYQFYEKERCLYVGKALNLKNRLGSYFTPKDTDGARIVEMVGRADRVEWVVLESETDALLTEVSLIARLNPLYNIRLREDHPYPSIAIDKRDGTARIIPWRGAAQKNVEVYGPYPGGVAKNLTDAALTVAPVRSCDRGKFKMHQRMKKPCLLAEVGRCAGPCAGGEKEHEEAVVVLRSILRGKTKEIASKIESEMQEASKNLKFEHAAKLRDRLEAISRIKEAQNVNDADGRDLEIVGTYLDGVGGAAAVISVRSGLIVNTRYYVIDAGVADESSLFEAVNGTLQQGVEIVSRVNIDASTKTPLSQRDLRLVELAETNALEALKRSRMKRASNLDMRRGELLKLQEALQLKKSPLRIESVDISHLGGAATVSVVSLLVDGLPVRNRYRKYRLKEHGGDDYAAMREVITRRLVDSIDGKAPFMDLLLIDGGRNQLAVAVDVIKELGVEDKLEVASLAKRLEEVFLPDREEPVILEKTNAGLLLLQRARDETHAASNKFQQKVASKILRKDYLDDVEGLGEKRKQLLLDKIGGWRGLEDANFEQLESIQAIPKKVREKVWDLLEERRAATNKTE
jgi:excinuclease ABC subunit C